MSRLDRAIKKMRDEVADGDWWGEHPDFTREEWRQEVAERNVNSGYWEWAFACKEEKEWEDAN